jgi:hypothetical protein
MPGGEQDVSSRRQLVQLKGSQSHAGGEQEASSRHWSTSGQCVIDKQHMACCSTHPYIWGHDGAPRCGGWCNGVMVGCTVSLWHVCG